MKGDEESTNSVFLSQFVFVDGDESMIITHKYDFVEGKCFRIHDVDKCVVVALPDAARNYSVIKLMGTNSQHVTIALDMGKQTIKMCGQIQYYQNPILRSDLTVFATVSFEKLNDISEKVKKQEEGEHKNKGKVYSTVED